MFKEDMLPEMGNTKVCCIPLGVFLTGIEKLGINPIVHVVAEVEGGFNLKIIAGKVLSVLDIHRAMDLNDSRRVYLQCASVWKVQHDTPKRYVLWVRKDVAWDIDCEYNFNKLERGL